MGLELVGLELVSSGFLKAGFIYFQTCRPQVHKLKVCELDI